MKETPSRRESERSEIQLLCEDDTKSENHTMISEFEKMLSDQERDQIDVQKELRVKIEEVLLEFKRMSKVSADGKSGQLPDPV